MNTIALVGSGAVAKCFAKKISRTSGIVDKCIVVTRNEVSGHRTVQEMADNGVAKELIICDVNDTDAFANILVSQDVDLVVNAGSTYCNEPVLNGCLQAGVSYIDASCAERPGESNAAAPWYQNIEAHYAPVFEEKGLSAILSIGFDPGVVNVFSSYAMRSIFDEIHSIDIVDVNDGSHGQYFATNFDPDVNLREIAEDVVYWEDGVYKSTTCLTRSVEFNFPGLGARRLYAVGHDEMHSLPHTLKVKNVRFWMGFSDHYIRVFTVLNKLGLLSNREIDVDGQQVVPIRVMRSLLPDPASLAENYVGEACIGVFVRGLVDGQPTSRFLYSVFDHEQTNQEIGEQAVSYSTAIPLVTATELFFCGAWVPKRMVHVEELNPEPFLELLPKHGIDWRCVDWDDTNFKEFAV